MKVFSNTTGKVFDSEDAVYNRNMIQSAFMLSKSDCVLLDVFENNGKIVMCFPRWMHQKYIRDWNERPHENKDNNNG